MGRIERMFFWGIWLVAIFFFVPLAKNMAWVSWGIFAIILIITILRMTGKIRELDIKRVFGFAPTGRKGPIRSIEQRRVDEVLQGLARQFDKAAQEQQKFLESLASPVKLLENKKFSKALKEAERSLKRKEREVSKAKNTFWSAHTLAEKEKYQVFANYKDYLHTAE